MIFTAISGTLLAMQEQIIEYQIKTDMLIEFFGVILLLALIVVPLMPRRPKSKTRSKSALKVNTDTHDAEYAINANGKLERIHGTSLIND